MIDFSVIIPVYNRVHVIAETVSTILAQRYPYFEIIVVDDGSTDGTGEVVRSVFHAEPRVKYFYKENGERAAARNFGIQRASGNYAVIFDSDDWMHADHLEVLAHKIMELGEEKLHFIAAKYQLKEGSGRLIPGGSFDLKEGWYDYRQLLRGNIFGCLYAINLSYKELVLFPEDRIYSTQEDWLFILANLRNSRLFLIDKITITVRHGSERSTADNQRVIKARRSSCAWLLENVKLTIAEQEELKAWSHYYCGIHEYLAGNRRQALREVFRAARLSGLNKRFFMLGFKSIIGYKLISKFR